MTFQWIFNNKYTRDLFAKVAQERVKITMKNKLGSSAYSVTVTFKPKEGWKLQWLAERARLLKEDI